jgi:hypothetical protein
MIAPNAGYYAVNKLSSGIDMLIELPIRKCLFEQVRRSERSRSRIFVIGIGFCLAVGTMALSARILKRWTASH